MRAERRVFALWSSARRAALSPRPARFMKYVSIRMPDPGPLGETLLDASSLAIVAALFVNSPARGCVESGVTLATHRFFFRFGIPSAHQQLENRSNTIGCSSTEIGITGKKRFVQDLNAFSERDCRHWPVTLEVFVGGNAIDPNVSRSRSARWPLPTSEPL